MMTEAETIRNLYAMTTDLAQTLEENPHEETLNIGAIMLETLFSAAHYLEEHAGIQRPESRRN